VIRKGPRPQPERPPRVALVKTQYESLDPHIWSAFARTTTRWRGAAAGHGVDFIRQKC
jgi:hypothetical protein